jgi:hypothetical protein
MTTGMPLLIAKDIIGQMEASGVLLPNGDFDDTKLDTLAENAAFIASVELILIQRGVPVPGTIDKIIRALPMIGLFVR